METSAVLTALTPWCVKLHLVAFVPVAISMQQLSIRRFCEASLGKRHHMVHLGILHPQNLLLA